MEELLTAIYNALCGDDDLTELVPAEQIRRGWNEPVDAPTIRFAGYGGRAVGDDVNNSEIIEESIIISILANGDLEIEPITKAVLNAMRAEAITDDEIEIHSCRFIGDSRGTFFDPLRKRHRKDLSCLINYSSLA